MANEYHDAQGRFCSKSDMQNAIAKLTVAGDFGAATALLADLKAIEEKRGKRKFVDAESVQRSTYQDGRTEWRRDGKLHREDGPAIEWADGGREWYRNGKPHRVDGPAIEDAGGIRAWYQNGKLHRVDGPAVERPKRSPEWWVGGKRHSEAEFNARRLRER